MCADTGVSGPGEEGARERRDSQRSLLSTDAGAQVRAGSVQVGKGGGDELYLRDALGALPCSLSRQCVEMQMMRRHTRAHTHARTRTHTHTHTHTHQKQCVAAGG